MPVTISKLLQCFSDLGESLLEVLRETMTQLLGDTLKLLDLLRLVKGALDFVCASSHNFSVVTDPTTVPCENLEATIMLAGGKKQ